MPRDVSFSVGRGKKKAILDGVSGRANAGKVLAVMGPSGSGKTTLLNALAGQAFVKQEDVFYSQLTVRETLLMAARLRLPSSVPLEEKSAMVDKLISKLGLSKVASTIVGDEKTRGISGGEKKRLSIACQLFGTPSLIFCDEPTTGLDAFQASAAERVMATLRQLAQDGHTVICSIHQPRSSIYGMFDDVLLLSEGRVMFQGPAKRIGSYFRSKGYPMPSHTNPGDFAVDVVSVDYTSKKTERRTKERIARFDAEHRASAPTSSSSSSSSSSLLSYFVSHWEKTGGEATEDEDEEEEGENKQKQKEKEKEEVTEVAETAAAAAAAVVKGGATSSKAAAQRRGKATQRKGKAAAKRGSKAAAKKGSKAVQRRSGDGEKRAGAMEQFRLLLARSWRQVNRAKDESAEEERLKKKK
ncbi:ABC [Ectocarpus sp. CCAP 1310/34]|nr:ABC [Ectocarpus sp. CCAP 1310/34]